MTPTLRSGFGSQPFSTKNSNPSFGFGSSIREQADKQYLSKDHAKVMPGNNSQGPIYKVTTCLGPQSDSKVESMPLYSFGTEARLPKRDMNAAPGPGAYKIAGSLAKQPLSNKQTAENAVFGNSTRDQQDKVYMEGEGADKAFFGLESPGPGTYVVVGAIGRQKLSTKESAPTFKLGTSQRFNYDFVKRARDTPGAGQYPINGAVGKQPFSTKKTLPAYRFGTATRDNMKKQFISTEHEKSSYGENSPGPVTADLRSSMGKQELSMKKTNPKWGFGKAKRKTIETTDNPGPGAYYA